MGGVDELKFTIGKKIWLGFVSVIILSIIISTLSVLVIGDITEKYNQLLDDEIMKGDLVDDIIINQKEITAVIGEFMYTNKQETETKMTKLIDSGKDHIAEFEGVMKDSQHIALVDQLKINADLLFETNNQIIAEKNSGGNIAVLTKKASNFNLSVVSTLEKIESLLKEDTKTIQSDIKDYLKSVYIFIIAVNIASFVVSLIVATMISRKISNPIKKVTAGLEKIAEGQLNVQPITVTNKDEVGDMAKMYNKMLDDLSSIVKQVNGSAIQLAANAEELSASAEENLAASQVVAGSATQQIQMGEQQGAYIETAVDSMNELNAGMRQIARSNEQMLSSTSNVGHLIGKGSAVVTDVAEQMETIYRTFKETTSIIENMNKHSKDIQIVTALITSIAEQTNLLALNASIEAARAGDAGKGFMVVAQEVGKLADQSKKSAIEISTMLQLIEKASNEATSSILNGGQKVEGGIAKTSESILVFDEIETGVDEVVGHVEAVSAAIEEIQAMTETVLDNTSHVQILAQQVTESAYATNSATGEQLAINTEISSNAQALSDLADALQNQVSHFQV